MSVAIGINSRFITCRNTCKLFLRSDSLEDVIYFGLPDGCKKDITHDAPNNNYSRSIRLYVYIKHAAVAQNSYAIAKKIYAL